MASPRLKYSNNAIITTSAKARARTAVELHKASPTANGISSAAVATRFHVIEKESPEQSPPSSHHIARNKSLTRSTPYMTRDNVEVSFEGHSLRIPEQFILKCCRHLTCGCLFRKENDSNDPPRGPVSRRKPGLRGYRRTGARASEIRAKPQATARG